MINKEKITTLVCLAILVIGIFDMLGQFNNLPRVPELVTSNSFQADPINPQELSQQVGTLDHFPDNWEMSVFLKDPWKETGLWRVPQLEKMSPPPPMSSRGYVKPHLKTPEGYLVPALQFHKELPEKIEEKTPESPKGTESGADGTGQSGNTPPGEKKEGEKKEGSSSGSGN